MSRLPQAILLPAAGIRLVWLVKSTLSKQNRRHEKPLYSADVFQARGEWSRGYPELKRLVRRGEWGRSGSGSRQQVKVVDLKPFPQRIQEPAKGKMDTDSDQSEHPFPPGGLGR